MPYTRQQNSIKSAISSLLNAERLKSIPNPTQADLLAIQQATNTACDVIENSGFMTLAEGADDNIETMHQVDRILAEGGIDRVAEQRENAITGAENMVAQRQLEGGDVVNVPQQPLQIEAPTQDKDAEIPL